jgi:hypothetical protein
MAGWLNYCAEETVLSTGTAGDMVLLSVMLRM